MVTVKEISLSGKTLRLETGRLAKQADGAVLVQYGDTVVLCTVVSRAEPADYTDAKFGCLYSKCGNCQWRNSNVPALALWQAFERLGTS